MKKLLSFQDFLNEKYQDKMPGGKGDKLKPEDVDQDELKVGIEVEREHVDSDTERATEIALDHLAENPKYYSDLIKSGIVDEKPALDLAKELGWMNESISSEVTIKLSYIHTESTGEWLEQNKVVTKNNYKKEIQSYLDQTKKEKEALEYKWQTNGEEGYLGFNVEYVEGDKKLWQEIAKYSYSIDESTSTILSAEFGGSGPDPKPFLRVIYSMSIEELEIVLAKSKDDLKWLKAHSKGVLGAFNRKDAQYVESRMSLIKDVIKRKKSDPDFYPDFLKEALSKGSDYKNPDLRKHREDIDKTHDVEKILKDYIEKHTDLSPSVAKSALISWKVGKDARIDGTLVDDIIIGSLSESFHMPDGTPIGVDHLHRPVSKITEEDSNNITLNVSISNIDQETAEDFLKMFAFMEWTGAVGAGRSFEAYFDGDGHFRPKIKVEGYDLKDIDFSANWNKNEDTVKLDFGA